MNQASGYQASRQENNTLNLMYGTYSDILFILFPFLAIALQRLWNGEGASILTRPDLSIAAAILAGLAMGKFVLGLVTQRKLGPYKERIVFFIAVTVFAVLGPSLMLALRIAGSEAGDVPKFAAFVQPIMLIIAISLYTMAINICNILTDNGGLGTIEESRYRPLEGSDEGDETSESGADKGADKTAPQKKPLVIPRREQG